MAITSKKIKAAIGYTRLRPEQLLAEGYTVVNSMRGHERFHNPPVDLDGLEGMLDAYSGTIGVAKDGSKTAIALRNRQSGEIAVQLRVLADYVELRCQEDLHLFLTSGFQPRTGVRGTPKPLDQPVIEFIDQGMSGQLLVWIKPVRKAKIYELRFGPADAGGAVTSWQVQTFGQAKAAAAVDGLTPGVIYAIQVRAFGSRGYTEWSPTFSRMCI